MASKTLFSSTPGPRLPVATTRNEAGGLAYGLSPKAALAQYAVTGCLSATFYASAEMQLTTVLNLCAHPEVSPEYIARLAIYSRQKGNMKDLPALLCATLAVFSPGLLAEVFDRVIDDGRMLRNFVQIIRSGVTGRKSLGSLPKRLVQNWFDHRSDETIFRASVGNAPSLADVIKMVHPKPKTESRKALYAYLIGKPHDAALLPELVRQFEAFKSGNRKEAPDVPFQMLTSLNLKPEHWKTIAENAPWQMTRMNLNTFARHGVFEDRRLTHAIAKRLKNESLIERARVFPYQLMVAYSQTDAKVPAVVREALQDAMEIATRNVPALADGVFVLPDISGSMHSAITGNRKGATSAVRCIDIAALVAATVLRTNRQADVIPFESKAIQISLKPHAKTMTNAQILSSLPAGGTNCSAALEELNRRNARGNLVIYVSDNESWIDSPHYGRFGGASTATMREWAIFKQRNPHAKMVCIDIQPYSTTQAVSTNPRDPDVLNIGGFSDHVFEVISDFAKGALGSEQWTGRIEAISL